MKARLCNISSFCFVIILCCSMGALDALFSKNTKKENLSERRKKLSELLLNEQKQLEVSV